MLCATVAGARSSAARPATGPRVPIVMVVGCATRTAEPHIWALSHASRRRETGHPGITSAEQTEAAHEPPGSDTYHLVGVADFVDAAASRTIGVRAGILSPSRVNATGMLADGHRAAVKGLYIDGNPARINLTSVIDLGGGCP